MNMDQFTQKTVAALQRAQSIAIEYQHMPVEQEHLMLALTEDSNELIPQLLAKCGQPGPHCPDLRSRPGARQGLHCQRCGAGSGGSGKDRQTDEG